MLERYWQADLDSDASNKNYISNRALLAGAVNRTSVRVGIFVIIAGGVLAGVGLLEKIAYENCLGMIRAFERGESGIIPVCPADPADRFFFAGLPVSAIGIVILVIGTKDLSLLRSFSKKPR